MKRVPGLLWSHIFLLLLNVPEPRTPPLNILIYLVYLPTDGHTGKQPDRLLTRQQTERETDRQRVRKCKHTDRQKER